MKKIYSLLVAALIGNIAAQAQTPCNNGRYATDVYTTYSVTSNIPYGANQTVSGTTQTLTLDFYQPTADTSTARPLIIWVHGGSFFGGTKTDVDVVSLSQHFAKKGYACASINYRVGFTPFDSSGIVPALLRAVQDLKASIRFFYKDKLTSNVYKVDTNNIFIGGSSAGAITALHAAYLNKSCEINPYINQTTLDASGGIDGTSGNPCYSSKVNGVINLCGALGKYGWIEPGDLPLCSMHGTADGTVLYGRGKANPGIPMLYLDGSRMMYAGTSTMGVSHSFYTWYGAGHVPYAGTNATALAYMDTTVNFVRDYLLTRLNCTNPPLQLPNTPAGTVTPYAYTTCTTNVVTQTCFVGIKEHTLTNLIQAVYPNPSNDVMKIVFTNANSIHTIQLTDITGKVLRTEVSAEESATIKKNNLAPGIYFLKISNEKNQSSVSKIMFN